ncbi:predicted protein [Sclerotinia sclerotiorum 1980 UF-70]|uniref:Uncharacterized protein n=1 Tax=Sclerotinia sclerotiorum (strain ATCC 18683 / 1980 / Ss-1) TaxID=665079 RepID=A7EWI0_SCLS1|nr:predicted protein [Sclerotinia sclerotiorum 1980 UF-70]EDN93822.1 predicted protein [Sclerotinia sclerotiorum 1980 UF-70]
MKSSGSFHCGVDGGSSVDERDDTPKILCIWRSNVRDIPATQHEESMDSPFLEIHHAMTP